MLAAKREPETFDTGLLGDDILRVYQQGSKRVIISYRKPQKTGIWLDGSEDALHVPLPGLLLVREGLTQPRYHMYAVKRKPSPGSKLYLPPLPNVSGGICWGTVAKPSNAALASCDMREDWEQFLGSRFGNHSTGGKCQSHPDDIRKLLMELHDNQARRYPVGELVEAHGRTFGTWMSKLCKS